MSNTEDPQKRVEEYLKKTGEDMVKHMEALNKTVFELAGSVFEHVQNTILQKFPEIEIVDANYIVTGVCVHVLAHHNAYTNSAEFARESALENYNTWYKIAIESAIKVAEESRKNENA